MSQNKSRTPSPQNATAWSALKEDRSRYGLIQTLTGRIAWKIDSALGIQIYRIGLRNLNAAQLESRPWPPGIRVKILSSEELSLAALDPDLDLPPDLVEDSISAEDVVVGAFKDDLLVSYVFATTETAPHDEAFCVKTQKPYRYSFKSFTREEYRGQGISYHTNNLPARNLVFKERGCTDSVFFIAPWNLPSLQANTKLRGCSWIGWAVNLRVRGRPYSFRTRAVQKTGFLFSPRMNSPK